CPTFVTTNSIASEATVIFATDSYVAFAVLQSTFHTDWVRRMASSLETRLRYTPSDCFDTFPFPLRDAEMLGGVGEDLFIKRAIACRQLNYGLTDLYNSFHDPKNADPRIAELRVLHT